MVDCPQCDRDDFASERGLKIHITKRHEQGESKEDIIKSLQEVAEELGRAPTKGEFDEYGSCTSPVVSDRFGTYGEGVRQAGLDPVLDRTEHTVECAYCGNEFTLPRWDANRYDKHFCRNKMDTGGHSECYAEYRAENLHGEEIYNYEGGSLGGYGRGWWSVRKRAFNDDSGECQMCGVSDEEHYEEHGFGVDVHHRHAVRSFEEKEEAHQLPELITLCREHHRFWENLPIQPIGKRWTGES